MRSTVYCLDLEGILIPEIWVQVSHHYHLASLKLTTRDIPDYDRLMRYRLGILKKEGIRLRDIQSVIRRMNPLPGAKKFLNRLRREGPVVIVSDTYYQFAGPLMEKLGGPVLLCNQLKTNRAGFITRYHLRQKDGKKKVARGLRKMGFYVKAVGDSYNDLGMLLAADQGIFFNPPEAIRRKYRRFPAATAYSSLLKFLLRP